MKLTTGILAVGLMTGGLWAQNPNVVNNVQSTSPAAQPAKTTPSVTQAAKPGAITPVAAAAKGAAAPAAPVATAAAKAATKPTPKRKSAIAAKDSAPKPAGKAVAPATTKISADAKAADASKSAEASKAPKPEEKKWAMSGKRDPFFSPVVQQPTGSGCSTGKKCLEIGQINLRGVVKSESGFIAVVTNSLNKAYFLRENDPVFNGYVMRITGDTVVFEETVQDKLGKPLTREVVKRIFTPAV
jgi:Tfp pilus assembly protein PilP